MLFVSFEVMDSSSAHVEERNLSYNTSKYKCLGNSCPKSTAVFVCQMLVVFIVICASIDNLSTHSEHSTLWTSLLSSCMGYILPHPVIKKLKQ